jgi:hypothetical protein
MEMGSPFASENDVSAELAFLDQLDRLGPTDWHEPSRYELAVLVTHLDEGDPLTALLTVARAHARGRSCVGADEIAAVLGQYGRRSEWISSSQANHLCDLGLLAVVDPAPRTYRLQDPQAVFEGLRLRGLNVEPPRARHRLSPLGA